MRTKHEVSVGQVTVQTSPDDLPSTPMELNSRLPLLPARTRHALALGLSPRNPGFHTFITADPELQLESDVIEATREAAMDLPAPSDIVFVHDFEHPEQPRSLELPPGRGQQLARDVEQTMAAIRREILSLDSNQSLREMENALANELRNKNKQVVSDLEAFAKSLGFGVKSVPGGVQTFPILHGKPVSSEQFEILDESTKRELSAAEVKLSDAVQKAAQRIEQMTEEVNAATNEALQQAAEAVIDELMKPLMAAYADVDLVGEYIDQVRANLMSDWKDFILPEGEADSPERRALTPDSLDLSNPEVAKRNDRFRVNVFVTHDPEAPAPVVQVTGPNYSQIFGYLERRATFGTLLTDFLRIRAGDMSKAHGGYLIVRATDLLADPLIWARFKRVLRDGEITVEDPLGPLGMYATTLRPRPTPLDVRVILIGPEHIYESLLLADPEFSTLFRIKVEVDWWIERNKQTEAKLDGYLMTLPSVKATARTFGRDARAKLLDYATRLAGDQERLALTSLALEETACFAALLAREQETPQVEAKHIEQAWNERRDRSSGLEKAMREMTVRGELLFETKGTRVGVVNGLSVLAAGDVEFGQPMRLTAVVSLGRDGVIDVEREAQLGGALHTKGIAIVRGFLSHKFGQERPLSLKVQVAFEQSYGEIDGDSASSTELFAILSSLADVGIDQGIAVTGSVNQLGEIQPIGGVCAKIEGFFDICKAHGLTGTQGVVIPKTNIRHLVLRPDVARSIQDGEFHLYAISSVEDGIEILTGLPAGSRDSAGRFPAGSVFGRVERRLIELAELLRTAEAGPSELSSPVDAADPEGMDPTETFHRR